jgi:hypothetical protein
MLGKALLSASVSASAPPAVYVEDVFSTYLYTGTGSTQTITNGIDLSGEGGLVWTKKRNVNLNHFLVDTERSALNAIYTSSTLAQEVKANTLTAFNADGFSIGTSGFVNENAQAYASWTFRKAEKFFDVVTYTGDGTDSRNISHNLAAKPGFIAVKRTNSTGDWFCGARSGNSGSDYVYQLLKLNSTNARAGSNGGSTDTTFNVGAISPAFEASTDTNINGATYVAYLFAHNAGGFGDAGTDSVVSCGSYATNSSYIGPNVNLGYEPQWILVKNAFANGAWYIIDNMRGWESGGNVTLLNPNTSSAESTTTQFKLNATGFQDNGAFAGDATMIYIAIRRGPMRAPESGTEVFNADFSNGPNSPPSFNSGFVTDLGIYKDRTGGASNTYDRLRGGFQLQMNSTGAESADSSTGKFDYMDGFGGSSGSLDTTLISWNFRRAPGFFDVVCYTGTGSVQNLTHNLGAVPELMIIKCRSQGGQHWIVYQTNTISTGVLLLASTSAASSNPYYPQYFNSTAPTSTVFTLNTGTDTNGSGLTFVNYLFATLAGVSKVGSYTGTGTTLSIDCGFTAGARFILIKRTDSTGDWYVWDTARGIVSGDDPYLLLNSTAVEVTNTDYIDPLSSGFQISSTAPAAINASGGSFIFLAIA